MTIVKLSVIYRVGVKRKGIIAPLKDLKALINKRPPLLATKSTTTPLTPLVEDEEIEVSSQTTATFAPTSKATTQTTKSTKSVN